MPVRRSFLAGILSLVAAVPVAAQQPAPQRSDNVIPALVAKAGTADAGAALTRLLELALQPGDAGLASDAVAAMARFGEEGSRALERVARDGLVVPARARALTLVIEQKRPAARTILVDIATSESPLTLRLQAIEALALDKASLASIEPLLTAHDPRVAACALRLLGRAHRPAATDRARELLGGDARATTGLKIVAVEVLRDEGSPDAIKALLAASARELGDVRTFALKSLAVMDRGAVLLLLLPMLEPTAPAEDALAAVEVVRLCRLPSTEEALRRALDHKDCDVRAAACRALGEVGDVTALPRLEKTALLPDCTVAAAAIEAVTRLRRDDPDWRDKLLKLSRAPRPEIRLAAVDSLASLADPTLLTLLITLLDDRDWRVRESAAEGLGLLRMREAVGPLIDHLEKERYRVRDTIAIALRRITGMPFDESRSAWRRWFTDHGAGFTVPPLAEVEAMEARLAKARAASTTKASFYGVPVTSDHVTVVVDVSGSMAEPAHPDALPVTGAPGSDPLGPTKLDVAKQECTKLLDQMPDGSQLNLLFFSDGVERWQHGVIELDRPRIARAATFVRDRRAGGATNLYEALAQALSDSETDAIYLLTDGEPTAGKIIDPALLRADVRHRNHARRVRVHAIALGHSSALLKHLADDSGGTYDER